jgi:hypothetical protein
MSDEWIQEDDDDEYVCSKYFVDFNIELVISCLISFYSFIF